MTARKIACVFWLFGLAYPCFVLAQNQPQASPAPTATPAPTPEQGKQTGSIKSGVQQILSLQETNPPMKGYVEILSDTKGVDFGPFLQRVLYHIKNNWYNLIPDVAKPPLMKSGLLIIQFAIMKNGSIQGMRLQQSSGDQLLDRAAWGGIIASDPFDRLPPEFSGNYLALRIKFVYNQKEAGETIQISDFRKQPPTFNVPFGLHLNDPRRAPPAAQSGKGEKEEIEPTHQDQAEDIMVISDTHGLNLNSYLQWLVLSVRNRWLEVIPGQARKPAAKSGTVIIRFAVLSDGTVARMRLYEPSGNAELDEAAWQSISGSSPFGPLPKELSGHDLVVSLKFQYNPKTEERALSGPGHTLIFFGDNPRENTTSTKP